MPQFVAGQELTADQLNALVIEVTSLVAASGGASTTSEFLVGTFPAVTVANALAVGNGFAVKALGTFTTAVSETLILRMRLDSLTGAFIASTPAVSLTAMTSTWSLDDFFYVTSIGSSGTLIADTKWVLPPGTGNPPLTNIINPASIDTTAGHSIIVTGQFSVSNASNLVSSVGGNIDRI